MLAKNDIITVEIESITSEGLGVAHCDGMAVFVADSAPGDVIEARLVKVLLRLCYARVERVLKPSPDRVEPDCPVCRRCGGCALRHISYEAELRQKSRWVADALRRIGGVEPEMPPIIPSPLVNGYRNKAQYPIGAGEGGAYCGFYAERSHALVPAEGCLLTPPVFSAICRAVCGYIDRSGAAPYDERTGRGLFRHLYLRRGEATGEVMVMLVTNGDRIPQPQLLVDAVRAACPEVVSVQLSPNRRRDNVILGETAVTLWGRDTIADELCGRRFELSPLAFYQVNRGCAQLLYGEAARLAAPDGGGLLLDLYCGAGTIGISMADRARQVIGVEIVTQAVEDARHNARLNGLDNCRFICADAGAAAARLAAESLRPDTVILDPPRKGCDAATLEAVAKMGPERVVMISCNPATAARDIKALTALGYEAKSARAADMFPRTSHVECVISMSMITPGRE